MTDFEFELALKRLLRARPAKRFWLTNRERAIANALKYVVRTSPNGDGALHDFLSWFESESFPDPELQK
jgi:hypothetical protein